MTTHFQLFDLPENATEEQIRTRYKQLAARCHPDKGGSSQLMIMIKNSYQKLIIGEGSLAINQHLDDSNKQIIELKKTIHQQQFYIQKLSVAIAKQAQKKETKRLKKILMPAALAVLSILVLVLVSENYQSRQQLSQAIASLAEQQTAKTVQIQAPAAPEGIEQDQSEIWELKQKLRLSRAMQQYLETDLDTSLAIIQHQLSNAAMPLSQAQRQFLAQYELNGSSINKDAVANTPLSLKQSSPETEMSAPSQAQAQAQAQQNEKAVESSTNQD